MTHLEKLPYPHYLKMLQKTLLLSLTLFIVNCPAENNHPSFFERLLVENFNPFKKKIPKTFTVGGTIVGLCANQSITLQNNGANNQVFNGSGAFTLTAQQDLSSYMVTLLSSPTGVSCNVTNGSGTVSGGNVTNVAIACSGCMSCGGAGQFTITWQSSRSFDVNNALGGGHKIYYDTAPGITTASAGVLDVPNTTSTTQGVVTGRESGCTYYYRVGGYSALNPNGGELSDEASITIP